MFCGRKWVWFYVRVIVWQDADSAPLVAGSIPVRSGDPGGGMDQGGSLGRARICSRGILRSLGDETSPRSVLSLMLNYTLHLTNLLLIEPLAKPPEVWRNARR